MDYGGKEEGKNTMKGTNKKVKTQKRNLIKLLNQI